MNVANSSPIARMQFIVSLVLVVVVCCGTRTCAQSVKQFQELSQRLTELHRPMGPVKPGDWLNSHNESGQTFRQYVKSRPIKLTRKRNKLYVLPLGTFDENQKKIVDLSTEFLGLYFGCESKTMPTLPLEVIPNKARRVHPNWGMRQIKSTYVLSDVLYPRLPKDAAALIALTSSDLYPDDNWNFVFGQASLKNRVGVWSMFRNGDPETEFQKCLKRTLQTATHETGHMFSIEHCIAFECNMCGSNNRQESDRRPLYLCPECLPKIWWATKTDPNSRFEKLIKFCETHGLKTEQEYFTKALARIGEQPKR